MHLHNNIVSTPVSPGIMSKPEMIFYPALGIIIGLFSHIILAMLLDYLCPRDTVQTVRLITNSNQNSAVIDRPPCYDVVIQKPPDYAPPDINQ